MQLQADKVHLPSDVDAIPRKFGSSMAHMKAAQVGLNDFIIMIRYSLFVIH